MTYKERSERFKEIARRENNAPGSLKWRNPEELSSYLVRFGGRLKDDRKRRRGYLVSVLQESSIKYPPIIAEVPVDFAEKVLAMGGFP